MKAIDLFSGWGGFTLGAEQAGVRVVWAGNHWKLAVDAHAVNHPHVEHVCQDLRQADWTALPRFDVMLASPACQGHSTASQPKRRLYHDEMRATAWSVVDCADVTEPKALIVENVPAFLRWRLFDVWKAALERLGYKLTVRTLRASYLGTPQRRERLFIVGSKKRALDLHVNETLREAAFGPHIEWSAPGWRPISQATPGAQARIRAAVARCGTRCLSQHVTGHPGVPLDEPIRTITTKDQWAVVRDGMYRPLTIRETARGMGFPDAYGWPAGATRRDVITGLGNAVPPPVAKAVVAHVAGQL
jgi:DNA (cytosine-5)-methyltransferase 1